MNPGTGLAMLASGSAMLVHVGLAIAFLVVGATTIRRAHPSAGWLVVLSASIDLVSLCLGMVGQALAARMSSDVEEVLQRNAIFTLLGIFLGLGSSGTLLAALVQLATRAPGRGIRGD